MLIEILFLLATLCISCPRFILLASKHNVDKLLDGILKAHFLSLTRQFDQFSEDRDQGVGLGANYFSTTQVSRLCADCEVLESCLWVLGAFESAETLKVTDSSPASGLIDSNQWKKAAMSFIDSIGNLFTQNQATHPPGAATAPSQPQLRTPSTVCESLLNTGCLNTLHSIHIAYVEVEDLYNAHVGEETEDTESFSKALYRLEFAAMWCICSLTRNLSQDNIPFFVNAFETVSMILKKVGSRKDGFPADLDDHLLRFSTWSLSNITIDAVGRAAFLASDALNHIVPLLLHKDYDIRWRSVRTIYNVGAGSYEETRKVIDAGALPLLKEVILDAEGVDFMTYIKHHVETEGAEVSFQKFCQLKYEALETLANCVSDNTPSEIASQDDIVDQVLFNEPITDTSFLSEMFKLALLATNASMNGVFKALSPRSFNNLFHVIIGARSLLLTAAKCCGEEQLLELIRHGVLGVVMEIITEQHVIDKEYISKIEAYVVLDHVLTKCNQSGFTMNHYYGYETLDTPRQRGNTFPTEPTEPNVAVHLMNENGYWALVERKLRKCSAVEKAQLNSILEYKRA